jgi:MoaA/NifB/PqqE/SkfB family radical SAM enzyme
VLLNEGDAAPQRTPPSRPARKAPRTAEAPGAPDRFGAALALHGLPALVRGATRTLQVNMGKWCNQTCAHCHVDAGPTRKERMEARVVERVLAVLRASEAITTVDITGGAPELNPHFRRLVNGAMAAGKDVLLRCNLTVLLAPGQQDTPRFLAERGVTIIASLPCWLETNVDRQRGPGVFAASVRALRALNELGYGMLEDAPAPPEDDGDLDELDRPPALRLHLVHNPLGPALPGPQAALQADYRRHLRDEHGVRFDRLFVLANMPIHRFGEDLRRAGALAAYEELLEQRFNPRAVPGVMCRELVSVDWDGRLADCDFNAMLGLSPGARARTIFDVDDLAELDQRPIRTGSHCLGCTAGQGSSCGGALADA